MQHSFDIDIAAKYGITEAILLNNMYFWIEKNRANETNFHDGTYWTYNSVRAFGQLFPYLSDKKIKGALKNLITEGILITGNYNKSAYDRTLWYALTEKGFSICQKGLMENTKKQNGFSELGQPIPYINTNIKTDVKTYNGASQDDANISKPKHFTPPTVEEVKAYCAERRNGIDAEYFIDYYEARNWELTKGRKVKDWKACIRTWEKNNYSKGKSGIEIDNKFRSFLAQNEVVDFGI